MIVDRIREARESLTDVELPDDLDDLAAILVALTDLARDVSTLRRDTENALGTVMPARQAVVDGVAVVERHRRNRRTGWDTEELLRDVLDSRLVNEATGELIEETPLDKVLAVWSLGAPRVTALRERGLQDDEYCDVTAEPGWSIRVIESYDEEEQR